MQRLEALALSGQWEEIEMDGQPEPLYLSRMLKMFDQPYFPGGFSNQPYIHILEMKAVKEAEDEFLRVELINLQIEAQNANSKRT